jgi:hypothetical protein
MAAVAWVGKGFTPFLVAPLAVLAYVAGLRLTGALEQAQVAAFQGFFARKLGGIRRRMMGSAG